ncbi:Carbonic anhydrase, alpha class [hydrothermal vent metagenome]|uniref:carbonic anhydrase n=1 Tax=hydrothermal vent metagenome TaxID=652676 RepID=A0A3B1BLI6_9ZZZZ
MHYFKMKYLGLIFVPLTLLLTSLHAATQHVDSSHAIHWGYSGPAGPGKWGSIANEFVLCGSGKHQSPVDIKNEKPAALYPLRFQYQSIPLRVVNNGHTLQANYDTVSGDQIISIGGKPYPIQAIPVYNSSLMVGDVSYKLLQLHFHSPSEHARKGERYAMEVHLVHKNANGNLAVVSVLLKRGRQNPTLQKVLDNVSSNINEIKVAQGTSISAADLLPRKHQLFHYSGSLTTPPCSENVNWFVMKTPMTVSDKQVTQFLNLIGKNARPLQGMHWRSMLVSE